MSASSEGVGRLGMFTGRRKVGPHGEDAGLPEERVDELCSRFVAAVLTSAASYNFGAGVPAMSWVAAADLGEG
eukprot:9467691-Pyramimonas_sp.AAC.1